MSSVTNTITVIGIAITDITFTNIRSVMILVMTITINIIITAIIMLPLPIYFVIFIVSGDSNRSNIATVYYDYQHYYYQ